MSTWNSITIHNPGDLTLDTLPSALWAEGEIWEGRDEDDEREGWPAGRFGAWDKGRDPNPKGAIRVSGHSKYTAEAAGACLLELSKGRRIEWSQEWSEDEPGSSLDVFIDGVRSREESTHDMQVPDNLSDLIAAARKALAVRGRESARLIHAQRALENLLDALDPQTPKEK